MPAEWLPKWMIFRWDAVLQTFTCVGKNFDTRGQAHQWGRMYRQNRPGIFLRGDRLLYVEYYPKDR